MRDSELAVSIVDGDPRALAEAYDKYGDLLWSYCRSMLRDGDFAAEAVLDTFVIASSRLEVLHAVGRLRAWLYAVARVECLRRLRTSRTSAAVDEAPRLRRAAAVLSTGEQRQFRAVLRAAFGGLDDAERDVMTMVWHGLDVAEVAVVLGLSRSDAYALFTRARDQLEEAVGVLLVGWSGRVDCGELDAMLTGHDRRLTPDLRVRLMRHLSRCGICAQRHRREMRPALTLGLSMGALLAEASDARAVAGRAPTGLWEEVYRMTSDKGPEAVWRRAMGGRRLSFGEDGFPKALGGRDGLMTGPRLAVAAVGTVAVAATATGFAATSHHVAVVGTSASSAPITAVMPEAASTASVPIGPSSHSAVVHGKTVTVRPGRASGAASPSGLPATGYASSSTRGSASASSTRGATSSPSTSSSSSGSPSSSPSTGSSGSASPSSSASASPSSSASSSPSGSAGTAATQGTLSASTSNIALAVGGSASFTLTANGGPVNWSISEPSGLLGSISLSQSSGTLAAGQSVTITVEASGLATVGTPLTISPGGQTVTVDISLL
ncbi:MAG TPA: sigma-70 family RNA polymerase sigma factor [Trebonia sp.]|jgi:RNA polymerase sigma factor (sigma-70 family)|nr:sigma-70 family RNA polymerase sigma factor [Trebonia sp.]